MARSQNSFNKKEREKKKLRKRKEKQERREERKASQEDNAGSLDNMLAYVDEFGNIVDTPPDPTKKKKEIKAENIELGVPKTEDEPLDASRVGTVAFFNQNKGYGFIDEDQTKERYFVHMNDLKEPIRDGNRVSFKLKKGPKGLIASEVETVK